MTIGLEVFPSKMNYKEDYKALFREINESIYNLSFDFLKSTYQQAGVTHYQQPSLTEFYSILQKHSQELLKALRIIALRPHHILNQSSTIGKPKAKGLKATQATQYLMKHPHYLVREGGKYIPQKALNVMKEVTYDTKENQWVKYWGITLIQKLQRLRIHYQSLARQKDQEWLGKVHRFEQQLQKVFKQYPFNEVSEPQGAPSLSFVFQMGEGYKEFYKLYQVLLRSLSLIDGMYRISTKNVAELYEYWCFIKMGMILRQKYQLLTQDVVKINQRGIFVGLEKGKDSNLVYRNPITKEKFKLTYNPKSTKLPTVSQQPDNVLELDKEMKGVRYKYLLDAKYKVELEPQGNYLRPKEGDINTMHRYRDAIVYNSKENGYERTVFGAIVLFPGQNEEAYKEDALYKSIEKVGIGGLPFLPSNTQCVEAFLDELIDASGHEQYQHISLPQGTKSYFAEREIEKRDVLIGSTRNKEQIEKIKKHLIYHIPLKHIRDKFLQFKYIALYQSQGGKECMGGIYDIGKVKNIRIKKRKELVKYFPTQQSNLEEEYVVFELEEVETLKKPILAKRYGISSRMYTNHTLLKYAETLPELSIKNYKEFELYMKLKRIVTEYESSNINEQYKLQIGNAWIYMGAEGIVCEKEDSIESIPVDKFFSNPRKYLYQYGLL